VEHLQKASEYDEVRALARGAKTAPANIASTSAMAEMDLFRMV
jgi:hypothetical protein